MNKNITTEGAAMGTTTARLYCHSEGKARRISTDKESIDMKLHRDISLTLNRTKVENE